jgi:lauroyl/myristoyl acyltransferase
MSSTPIPRWSLQAQALEYGWLVPAMARLPDALAYPLARWRGALNARHDRDWVSLSLRHRHVAAMAEQGLAQILPAQAVGAAVVERFETVAREEMEARALELHGLGHFQMDVADALARLATRPAGRGLVLVTPHLETFVLGIAALASTGARVHPVMSSVSEDPRVHPAIRAHFRLKYRGLERHLNGGQLADAETSMRYFYRALSQGDVVVVIADAPAPPDSPGVCLPFLGAQRQVAQGALRLATQSGSLLAAFACHWQGGRRHSVAMSELWDPQEDATAAYAHAFAFMEQHIRVNPGRWWASHLLPLYPAC